MDLTTTRTREFVLTLENEPGTLGRLATLLAEHNILGFAVIGQGEDAQARLVTNDASNTETLLRAAGYEPGIVESLAVEVDNKAGQLARLANQMGVGGVNIDASFVSTSADGRRLMCVFAVDELDRAERAIGALAAPA